MAQPAVRHAQAAVSTVQAGGGARQQCHRRGQHRGYCQETQAPGSDACSEVAGRGCGLPCVQVACCMLCWGLCKSCVHKGLSQVVKRMVKKKLGCKLQCPNWVPYLFLKQPTDAPAW